MKIVVHILVIAILFAGGCFSGRGQSFSRVGYNFSTVDKVAIVAVEGAMRSEQAKNQIADLFAMELLKKGYAPKERANVAAVLREQAVLALLDDGEPGVRALGPALDDAAPVAAGGPDPAEAAVTSREAARAREMLERLPEKQRLSVSLRIDEGLSFREIGEVIGSSEGAARVNYFHGIRRLRELME